MSHLLLSLPLSSPPLPASWAVLLKITLLLALAVVGLRILRRSSAAVRHMLAVMALVGLIAVPLFTLLLPAWSVPLPAGFGRMDAASLSEQPAARPVDPRPLSSPPSRPAKVPESRSSAIPASPAASPDFAAGPADSRSLLASMSMSQGLFWVWAAVASLLLLRLAAGGLRLAGWVARAEAVDDPRLQEVLADTASALGCRRPRLLLSAESRIPLLWGQLRPVVLLPSDAKSWTPSRWKIVITHELAHLDRGDWLSLLLGRVAVAIYWFHPLAWHLESRARRECEEACDDRVLAAGTRASDYASHLLDLARGVSSRVVPAPAVALLRTSQVEQRLRAILDPAAARKSPTRRVVVLAAGALLLFVVPLASMRLESAGSDPMMGGALEASATDGNEGASDGPEGLFDCASCSGKADSQIAQNLAGREDNPARRSRQRWQQREPSTGEEWYHAGYEMHRAEDWEGSAAAFQRAAEAGYRPGTSAYNTACALARLGRSDEAFAWLDRSREDGFDSSDRLLDDSDLDSLRSDARFKELLDEQQPSVWSRKRRPLDRLERAEAVYTELVDTASQNGDAWHEAGTDLLSLGQFDRAIEALERAVELDPHRSSTSRYNLACAYARAGRSDQALAALDAAVEAGFGSDERFQNDRDLDNIRGTSRFEEIRDKSDLLSLDGYRWHGKRGWSDWNDSRISPERWNPAVEVYRAFVAAHPGSGRGWFDLGYSLHYAGRHEEAIEAFHRALALDHKPSMQMYNIACANARLGRGDEALVWLERAAEAGMSISGRMDDDPDLRSLRSDVRFQELRRRYWKEEKEKAWAVQRDMVDGTLRKLGEWVGIPDESED